MRKSSSLTEQQRIAALALFEAGCGSKSTARDLGVNKSAVDAIYLRWRLRGSGAVVQMPNHPTYPFEVKLAVVQRCLAGETKIAVAQAFELSSPKLVGRWLLTFRNHGEDGLRPKPKGPRPKNPVRPAEKGSELERLRRENERLRAEVAYLGKLQALRAQERR